MPNLVLTRKAGEAVRFQIGDSFKYLEVLKVNGGQCAMRVLCLDELLRVGNVRLEEHMQISDDVSVQVCALSHGIAKLKFTAPKEILILRTELIKEDV